VLRLTLRTQLAAGLCAAAAAGAGAAAWLIGRWPAWAKLDLTTRGLLAAAAVVVTLCLAWMLAGRLLRPLTRLLRALEVAVLSYRDGDFSVSLGAPRRDELGELMRLHAELGHALREQRQHLAQRELLLDTVVQNTPVALVLTDLRERVAFANLAARQLLGEGRSLEGLDFAALLQSAPQALQQAVQAGDDTLFTVAIDGHDETFHLLQRGFRLQGRPHRLYLFRRMTRELSRQEVATWKRVIRVISHELNNSLAPISSLAHSGAELARRGDLERLQSALGVIGERVRHLHTFLDGYARFAKLPSPRLATVDWAPFIQHLAAQCRFDLQGALPSETAFFDAAQIEQALINLLKNAHESGTVPEAVTLTVTKAGSEWRLEVADRGSGMSAAVLDQALLPFYSTKRSGSGIGLALAREIAEAHGGRIALANREGGGLAVTLCLPVRPVGPVAL
jgi:nitrogen fixation/metabolism regulation signal transduction histidine kinase